MFEEHKPRRKREKPDSRARVAALESKLEDLIAQVGQNNGANQKRATSSGHNDRASPGNRVSPSDSRPPKSTPTTSNLFPTPESQTREGNRGLSIADHAFLTQESPDTRLDSFNTVFTQYMAEGATPEFLISEGHLSIEEIERFIGNFRDMSHYFPFVTIPHDATVYTMLKDRPLLLHAALAVATPSEVHLQKVLEKSFKEVMLRKLVLEAQKTIDILQSILICVAWGHFFHIPKRNQSYQLLQMAIGLCVDLGLNLTPSFAIQKKFGLHLDHYQPRGEADEDRFWSKEARRAFLGCYHASTMTSWIWQKPNTLKFSEYVLSCAKSISEDPEYPTDELILPLIQLQQVGDEYHKVLQVERNEMHSQVLLHRIGTHVRSFQKKTQDLKDSLAPTATNSTAVQLAIQFAAVYTYEQGLLSPFSSISLMMATGAPMDPMSNTIDSPSRIDILLDCLQSAMNYLDTFLTIPLTAYPLFGTSQWSGLIYSLVVVYRLSIGTPRVPLWDVQMARETVKLERYLELLCERIQQTTRERLKSIIEMNNRDIYSVMGLILQNVRNTYDRLRRLPQKESANDEQAVHATSFPDEVVIESGHLPRPRPGPIFEQEQPKPGYQSRCPAMQFWSASDSSSNGNTDFVGDDPFPNMNVTDDDSFWNQVFTTELAQWDANMDLGLAGF